MRSFLAGFFALLLGLSPAALGQVDPGSYVESIGINRAYRPDAWVPMLVSLKSTIGEPAQYQIQVVQPDIDGDRVVYSRLVTLNPNLTEKYWVYFRPRPTGIDALTVPELQKILRVRLCTRDGKELMILPLTTTVTDFDPKTTFNTSRGRKMVLAVVGGVSKPAWLDYDKNVAMGLIEDVEFLTVPVTDLPESILGYEMVDTVVWFDADAAGLTTGGSRKLAAIQEWVRQGGQLVVCHPDEPFRIAAFADMLPVHLKGPDDKWVAEMIDRATPDPLRRIATAPIVANANHPDAEIRAKRLIPDRWGDMKGPFRVARAPLKNDALAEDWVEWTADEGGGRTPFIARNAVGLGSVTWVAQNLGDRSVTGLGSSGWPHVWDRVFGWANKTVLVKLPNPQERNDVWGKDIDEWGAGQMADLGGVFLRATDHTGKAGAYVFLVILFFVGYWIVAGPGSYLFLAGKGQRQLSWAVFALSALAATLVTVAVVKLVLRGDPEVRHVSVVRFAPGNPTVVDSRIGLYIPRDGRQELALKDTVPDAASYITPLSIHPQHLGNPATFSDTAEYVVPVREVTGEEPVTVDVPYRSTLKKVQAHWVGNMPQGIEGWAGLVAQGSVDSDVEGRPVKAGFIEGRLVNKTGNDLKHVIFAFRFQEAFDDGTMQDQEFVLYVPGWKKDQAIDLLRTYAAADLLSELGRVNTAERYVRGSADNAIRGPLAGATGWGQHWLRSMKALARTDNLVDDSESPVTQSVAVLTLFDRLAPLKNDRGLSYTRAELLRRGGRQLNLSHALAAGNLVMIAEVDNAPLPFPLEVEGDRMQGEGTVYYQASIPLKNRSKLIEPLFTAKQQKAPGAAAEDGAAPAAADTAGQTLPQPDPAAAPPVQ